MWKRLTLFEAPIRKEKDLYAPLRNLLEVMGCAFWEDSDNENKERVFYPDFVIFKGKTWSPTKKSDHVNVLIDIELK
jgi:hypothetical protein